MTSAITVTITAIFSVDHQINLQREIETFFLSLSFFILQGIFFWSLLRLLNSKLYSGYERKQIEFNLPSHMRGQPVILQYIRIFVDFYILLLSSPLRRFPRAQSERIFIGSVCLLSLNIVSLFQSSLATVFINPMYYKNIENLQQFAESQQSILIKYPAMMTDLFPEGPLHDRMILVPKPTLTAFNVTNGMNMATVTRRITLKLLNEDNVVHMIPECPKTYNLAYLLSKHSVYSNRVNAILLDISQFGFINKWIAEANFDSKLEGIKKYPPQGTGARVLTVDDLMLSFIILLSGIVIAFTVLVFERLMKPKVIHYTFIN